MSFFRMSFSPSEIPRELWDAYRRTEYWIEMPSPPAEPVKPRKLRLCLRVDEDAAGLTCGLPGLPDLLKIPWAYLTAWNPRSAPETESVNRARQSELEKRLNRDGILCLPGVARDPLGRWPDEEGLLAMGLERGRALQLGKEFGQNAILTGVGEGKIALESCQD